MSYILDALRRAETEREREREHIPGLHTQQLGDPALEALKAPRPRQHKPRLLWVLGSLTALALALAAAMWLRQAAPLATHQDPTPSPRLDKPAEPIAQAKPPAAAMARPLAPERAMPMPPLLPAPAAPTPRPATLPTATPAPAPAPAAPASVPARIPALSELPAAQRQQLPPLTVGGGMHSTDPANRMLILNGQVYREGDTVAAGVVLEEIQQREAVLVWRGQRFRLTY